MKIIDARGKAAKNKPGSPEVALDYIGQLYRIEKIAREKHLSPGEMVSFRRGQAVADLSDLPGQALNYTLTRWYKLIGYIEDGHITPDNNAAATLYSLIETAKACGLDPYRYIRYLFSKLPYALIDQDYRALLPRNLTPEVLTRFAASP